MNVAFDKDTDSTGTIPEVAKRFKARNQPWALIVDDNYGEGSAREHAALQPRFYGMASPISLILADTDPITSRLRAHHCQVLR